MVAIIEEYDEVLFRQQVKYCQQLRAANGLRDEMLAGIEDMYLMHKSDADKALESANPSIALTKSPEERVAIKGVVRLMTSTYPKISIPRDINADDQDTDMLERLANALLAASDRATRRPLHYDATLSAVLSDSVMLRVTCSEDMRVMLEEDEKKRKVEKKDQMPAAMKGRIMKAITNSPYIIEVLNARACYPIWDRYGVKGFLHVTMATAQEIIDTYGDKAQDMLCGNNKSDINMLDSHEIWDWTDDVYRMIWISGKDKPIICKEHGLPFIPVVAVTCEGSPLFGSIEDQYEPFLMTVYRSGIDKWKTEALTATRTNMRVYGYSSVLDYEQSESGEEMPQLKRSGLFQIWTRPKGSQLNNMLNKGIVDPAVWNGLGLARELTEASTIFRSTLGQSQSNTYSQTALLSQLGRIPLETIKNMTGRAIADAVEIIFAWIRWNGKRIKVKNYRNGAMAELKNISDIPEYVNVECKLDVALPQDKMQQANIAVQLNKTGYVDTQWVQENILNIEQGKAMQKNILREQITQALVQTQIQKIVQEAMQPPQPPPGMQPPQMPMQQVEEGVGAMPGTPPEMMAGGMQGPDEVMAEGGMEGMV